jgi:hypothetical protein
MNSNVVPISRARSVPRRSAARSHLKPVVRVKAAAALRPAPAVASKPDTPIWFSIAALIAITMWPSGVVWLVQLAYRIVGR